MERKSFRKRSDPDQWYFDYLDRVNISTLRRRVKKFKKIRPCSMTDAEIRDDFDKVTAFGNRGPVIVQSTIEEGHVFFRLRGFPENASEVLKDSFYWEPSPEKVQIGRANRPGEPKLYLCTDLVTPTLEKLEEGEGGLMVVYEQYSPITHDLPVYTKANIKNESEKIQKANSAVNGFIEMLFRETENDGNWTKEEIHRMMSVITSEMMENSNSDAFSIPSSRHEKSYNFVFQIPGKDRLKILGALFVIRDNNTSRIMFEEGGLCMIEDKIEYVAMDHPDFKKLLRRIHRHYIDAIGKEIFDIDRMKFIFE